MGYFDNAFFPLIENGELDVAAFLGACGYLPKFFDLMSAALKPVKTDIENNIRKIQASYDRNREQYRTVRRLLEDEIRAGVQKKDNSACIGLLWLKRGLDYVLMLLQLVLESYRKGVQLESCYAEFRGAYDYALKRHHNWLSQKVFQVATLAFPKRSHLMRCLAYGSESSPIAEVIQRTEEYLQSLRPAIDYLNRLYVELQLESVETQYPKDFVPPVIANDDVAVKELANREVDEKQVGKLLDEATAAALTTDRTHSN